MKQHKLNKTVLPAVVRAVLFCKEVVKFKMRDFPMSLPGHFPHRGTEHLLSIPMGILEYLELLVEVFSPDWKALAMYWPEVLTFIILCVLLVFAFVYWGHFLDQLSAKVNNQQTPSKTSSHPKPKGRISHSYRTDSKNRELQQELLILLQRDVATAKRLLKRERRRHPNNSDNWYLEKVIWDLKRDRH